MTMVDQRVPLETTCGERKYQSGETLAAGKRFVEDEKRWRVSPPPIPLDTGRTLRVGISRWSNLENNGLVEVSSSNDDDSHALTIVQRRTSVEFTIGPRVVWSGTARPNEMLLTGPRQTTWHALVRGPFDQFRVYFPQALISECLTAALGHPPSSSISLFETDRVEDPTLQHLGQAFALLPAYDRVAGLCFADSLGLAYACRLVALHCRRSAPREIADCTSAVKPRIRLVLEYIEEHLGRPIYLSELSEMVGLSQVHFAVQFRAAVGLRPYAYIQRRRIKRAQELLQRKNATIVGVALDLGFSSQGHFTDVFRQIVGVPPGRWLSQKSGG